MVAAIKSSTIKNHICLDIICLAFGFETILHFFSSTLWKSPPIFLLQGLRVFCLFSSFFSGIRVVKNPCTVFGSSIQDLFTILSISAAKNCTTSCSKKNQEYVIYSDFQRHPILTISGLKNRTIHMISVKNFLYWLFLDLLFEEHVSNIDLS